MKNSEHHDFNTAKNSKIFPFSCRREILINPLKYETEFEEQQTKSESIKTEVTSMPIYFNRIIQKLLQRSETIT